MTKKFSTPLSDFFKRINFRKGQNYNPATQYIFLDEKRKLGLVKRIQKQITKFGLTNEEINFATN